MNEVQLNAVMASLQSQRNKALNDLAQAEGALVMANAVIKQLSAQVDRLKEGEPKDRVTAGPVSQKSDRKRTTPE